MLNELATELYGGKTDAVSLIRGSMFQKQLEFADAPEKMRGACCGRRSGKTQAVTRKGLIKCLERPDSVAIYFATTKARAAKLVWDTPDGLPAMIQDFGLQGRCTLNETDHRIDFDNGSVYWITGVDTMADARNWKGLRYDIADVDEAQDWDEQILRYMVDEALKYALMDRWKSAELVLTGTPGPLMTGLFYEITTGARKGWGHYGWTAEDNPHVDAKGFLGELLNERGLSIDDPIVQREFFGRWVQDVASQLFQYCAGRNDYDVLPGGEEWHHALGMDPGVRDACAFVLESWRRYDRTVYIQEAYAEVAKATDAPVTRMAEIIRGFQAKFGQAIALSMDCGALGLGYQLELRNRFGLNVEAAKKTEKAAAIEVMNDQLRLGRVKVSARCKALVTQWTKLQIDSKTRIEKPNQDCDLADAALYGWRHVYAYLAQPEPDLSPSAEQRRMIERILAAKNESTDRNLERERREMAQIPRYEGA
jgi:hypothetical protein